MGDCLVVRIRVRLSAGTGPILGDCLVVRIRIDRAQVLALYWETAWWLELG